MTDKTGGAAFPVPATELHGTDTGMTLRDYFAAQCMQGHWAADRFDYYDFPPGREDECLERDAKIFYRMADAMLKARGVIWEK